MQRGTSFALLVGRIVDRDVGTRRVLVRMLGTLAILVAAAGHVAAQSSTWTGAVSSDWSDAANWSGGVPSPTLGASVPGATPFDPSTAGTAAECAELVVSPGASLSVDAGFPLDVSGSATIEGTVQGGSAVRFVGPWNGSLSGSGALTNLELAKAPGALLTVQNSFTIDGDLTVTSGDFQTQVGGVVTVTGNGLFQGGQLSVFYGGTLDIEGDVTFAGTTANGAQPTIRCAGNWVGDASWSPPDGSVVLDGSGARTISGTGVEFANLVIESSTSVTTAVAASCSRSLTVNGSLATTSTLDVEWHLTIAGGATFDPGFGTHTVGRNINANGTTSPTGTIVADGATSGTASGPGTLPNLVVAKAPGALLNALSSLTIDGDLTVTSGEFRTQSDGVLVAVTGNGLFQGGQLSVTNGGSLDIEGDVSFTGTAASGAQPTILCAGNWLGDASWSPANGTVVLDGSGARTISGAAVEFASLVIESSTSVTTAVAASFSGSLTVNGSLATTSTLDVEEDLTTAAGATLDPGGGTHTVGGNIVADGAMSPTGTIVAVGPWNGSLSGSGALTNLELAKAPGALLTVQNSFTIDGDLTVTSGDFQTQVGGVVTVTGNGLFQGGQLSVYYGGTLDIEGDVTFAGTTANGAQPTILCAGNWVGDASWSPPAGTVELDGSGITTLSASVPGGIVQFSTLILRNGTRQAGNDLQLDLIQLTVESTGELAVDGTVLSLPSGSTTLNGALTIGPAGVLALHSGVALNVTAGATLSLIGSAFAPATITSAGGAGYGLTVNGTLAASNFAFENMGPGGIVIPTGATIAPFPNNLLGGSFSNPFAAPGATLLTIERATPTQVRFASFPDAPIAGVSNVRTTVGSAPITFVNFGGPFSGAGFEDDPGPGPEGNLIWAPEDRTDLATFTAAGGTELVTLDWTTNAEVDVDAFVLERGTAPGGPFTLVTEVPPAGPSSYQVVDAGLTGGVQYFYRLAERILVTGEVRVLGTADATPTAVATTLAYGAPPASPIPAGSLWPTFTVRVEDDLGNLDTSATDAVTIGATAGPGTIAGTLTRSAVAGIASFDDLSATAAGAYSFDVTSPGLTPILGTAVQVDPAAAIRLAFQTPPSTLTTVGLPWDSFSVRIEDDFGNLVTSATDVVIVTPTSGTGLLGGTSARAAVGGVATFDDLVHDVAETLDFDIESGGLVALVDNQVIVQPFDSDLRVAAAGLKFTPAAPAVGQLTLIEVGVVNAGQINTPAEVAFYLGNPNFGGVPIGLVQANVGIGAQTTFGINWTPASAGLESIFVVVDNLTPPESTPANNRSSRQVSVGAAPEALTVSAGERVAWPGAQCVVPITVRNVGASPATITGATFGPPSWLTLTTAIAGTTLQPGESVARLALLDVPAGASGAPLGGLPLVQPIPISVDTATATFGGNFQVKLFDQPAGSVTVQVVDDTTSAPIAGALVAAQDLPGEFVTDGAGEVILALAPGARSIFAFQNGYLAVAGTFEVPEGASTLEIRLVEGNTLGVEQIVSAPLGVQEILDRGITVDDPINNQVFDFTVAMRIGAPIVISNVELPIAPPPGTVVSFTAEGYVSGDDPSDNLVNGSLGTGRGGVVVTATFDYNAFGRTETWIIIPGKISVLKEFFEVTTIVVNNAIATNPADVQLDNVMATLTLPGGLGLPDLSGIPQQLTQSLPLIDAGGMEQATWTLRGDETGVYTVAGTVIADLLSFGVPVVGGSLVANAVSDPFEVTVPRMRCEFLTPGAVMAGAPFLFSVIVTNENTRVANLVRVTINEEDLINCFLDSTQPQAVLNLGSGSEILSAVVDLGDLDPAQSAQATFQLISDLTGTVLEVIAESGCGGAPSPPVEVIPDPPVIVTQPTDTFACDGTMATFTVVAGGAEPITYQWRKSGIDIPAATASVLLLDPVAEADAGTYDVLVTNSGGSVVSASATLTVDLLPAISGDPVGQTVCEGTPVAFSVTATGSALSYQWRRNGVDISGATSSEYAIPAASPADAGAYDAVVTNSCATVTSAPAVLMVLVTATITADPQQGTVCEGGDLQLDVTAAGTGTLEYQWRHDGLDISGATGASYTILSATQADAGNYDVVVSNSCGDATSTLAAIAVDSPATWRSPARPRTA